jgi:hypothetical protein
MELQKIRREYDQNYQKIIEIITQMGGETKIKVHRKLKTPLYQKLKELQRREHYLDRLESGYVEQ